VNTKFVELFSMSKKPSTKRVARRHTGWTKLPPVPPTTTVDLVYSTERTITATAGEVAWDFRPGSLFDPDFTYTGSQPVYFDQWGELYNFYRVTEALVDVWASTNTSSAYHLKLAAAPSMVSGLTSYFTEDVAGWRNAKEANYSTGGPMAHFQTRLRMHEVAGISEASYLASPEYRGGFTGNPDKPVYFAVRCKTFNATDNVWLSVRIRFRVRLESPEILQLSASAPALTALPRQTAENTATGKCQHITSRLIEHSPECAESYACGGVRLCEGQQAAAGSKTGRGLAPANSGHSS
jgi:hypothetical protein